MPTEGYRPRLKDLRPLVPAAPTIAFVETTIANTPAAMFDGRTGYDEGHLGDFIVPLPSTATIAGDVLAVADSPDDRLDYEHFSVVMSHSRRLALFTAVNIDGAASVSVPRAGDPWAFDGRIPEEAQIGPEVYANNDFDRGHLVRREDPNWGASASVANRDTFHYTNCSPQLSAYNQVTWLSLEDFILGNTRRWRERASIFTGPILRATDPIYRDAAIPLAYWKVVAFVHDDGRPSASAYMIDHDVDVDGMSLLFGPFKTYQRSVASIASLTGLDFGELADLDGLSNEEAATGRAVSRTIREAADILV